MTLRKSRIYIVVPMLVLLCSCEREESAPPVSPPPSAASTADQNAVTFSEPAQLFISEIHAKFPMPSKGLLFDVNAVSDQSNLNITIECNGSEIARGTVPGLTGRFIGLDMETYGDAGCNTESFALRVYTVRFGGTNLVQDVKPWQVRFKHGKMYLIQEPISELAETPK